MTDKHTKEELKSGQELGDIIRSFLDHIDKTYDLDEPLIIKCVWCGKYIENRSNIVLFQHDIYHLKCMTEVYKTEKENMDLWKMKQCPKCKKMIIVDDLVFVNKNKVGESNYFRHNCKKEDFEKWPKKYTN